MVKQWISRRKPPRKKQLRVQTTNNEVNDNEVEDTNNKHSRYDGTSNCNEEEVIMKLVPRRIIKMIM